MRPPTMRLAALFASLVGLAASIPPLADYMGEASSYCTSGCASLYTTPYIAFMPVELRLAAPLYFTLLVLACLLWLRGSEWGFRLLLGLVVVGVFIVPYLVYVEVAVGAFCIYCTIMHASILSLGGILAAGD